MEITYLGHSSFKLRGKTGTVVTDPYDPYVGFTMPTASADVVTVSHQHKDHNNVSAVSGTARRKNPFIVEKPGEYEVGGISVFGVPSFHDTNGGVERGANTIFTIMLDGLKVCHLGDLGHELSVEQRGQIGDIDVLLCPVGGAFTIDAQLAAKTIKLLEPSIAIPMHYKTKQHDEKVFGDVTDLQTFLEAYGAESKPEAKLNVETGRLPEELEIVTLASLGA